jgi:hypothetical protein
MYSGRSSRRSRTVEVGKSQAVERRGNELASTIGSPAALAGRRSCQADGQVCFGSSIYLEFMERASRMSLPRGIATLIPLWNRNFSVSRGV